MGIFEILQILSGFIFWASGILQLVKIVKSQSVEGISLLSVIGVVLGVLFMEMYAIHTALPALILTTTISLLLEIAKLSVILYYTKRA